MNAANQNASDLLTADQPPDIGEGMEMHEVTLQHLAKIDLNIRACFRVTDKHHH